MLPYLDVLKEAGYLTDLIHEMASVASREAIAPEVLRRRLLLVLFALGTNVGIKRIGATGGTPRTRRPPPPRDSPDLRARLRRATSCHTIFLGVDADDRLAVGDEARRGVVQGSGTSPPTS